MKCRRKLLGNDDSSDGDDDCFFVAMDCIFVSSVSYLWVTYLCKNTYKKETREKILYSSINPTSTAAEEAELVKKKDLRVRVSLLLPHCPLGL